MDSDSLKRKKEYVRQYNRLIEQQVGHAVRPLHVNDQFHGDGFVNLLNRYGTAQDTTEQYHFQREGDVPDDQLVSFYEGNGLFAKIIDTPAEEAVKHGFTMDDVNDPDTVDFFMEALDELDWEETAMTAGKWTRLFGGAIVVMLINDGRGIEEPLDWSNIQSIDDLRVYDRSVIVPDTSSMFTYQSNDPFRTRGSHLGMPEHYHVYSRYGTFTVHESRCLVFQNGTLPENCTNTDYQLWGIPEYLRIQRAIRDTELAHGSVVKMLDRSVQAVYKMKDLAQLLATEEGESAVLRRLQTIDLARGLLSSITIDNEGEDYDFKQFQFGGVNEVIDSTCNFLSALTSIPQTILFGRSPAGMNATGESDMENFYNYVERIQKRTLRSNLRYLLSVIAQAGMYTGEIKEIPKIKVSFNPLWSMSDLEQADLDMKKAQTQQIKAQTAQTYVDMQAIDPSEVRKKLAESEDFDVENMLDDMPDTEDELFEGLEMQEEDNPLEGNSSDTAPAATKLPQDMTDEELAQIAQKGAEMDDNTEGTQIPIEDVKHDSVGVVVISNGKVLCGTRMNDNATGTICGPGGKIEPGETPEEAAFRETEEEFGISPIELIPIGYGPAEPGSGHSPCIFLCTDYEGEPDCIDGEIASPQFLTLEEIEMLSPSMFQPFKDGLEKVISCLDDETLADGGPGSGNFGHEGRPGEVGGSSETGADTEPHKSLSKKSKELLKKRTDNPYGFGLTREEKAKDIAELAESLKNDGVKVEFDEHEGLYRACDPNGTYEEQFQICTALNEYGAGTPSKEEYIEACKAAGTEPDFHTSKDEIPQDYLKKADGTPVYSQLRASDILSNEEIRTYSSDTEINPDSAEKRKEAEKEAVSSMTPEEQTAVHGYTSQYGMNYQRINGYLGGETPDDKEAKTAAEHLTSALDHEIGADTLLYRGVSGVEHITDNEKIQKLVAKVQKGDFSGAAKIQAELQGKTVTNSIATSTSVAQSTEGYGTLPVQFVYKTPAKAKGVNITSLSAYGGGRSSAASVLGGSMSYESEVLMKPGMTYTIDRVDFSQRQIGKKTVGQIFLTCTVHE